MKNYYGSLCTEMYEILHQNAPQDELDFYLSYAEKGMSILEPLCGSGRFMIPFQARGFDIRGMDLSTEMIAKLKEKAPDAIVFQGDILEYISDERYDYIFISSGSVSLFTDMEMCKSILRKMKDLLNKGGKFVFAVDTVADRCSDDSEYKTSISVKTKEGFDLILKGKNYYDEKTHTQFSPGIYELYDGKTLLQQEQMDFQTHLYELGEIEEYLQDIGFTKVNAYASYDKVIAENNQAEMFLYECSI
ncbi:MAG: class I SAM-dependent methyltransferase [Lachnospiraceae bacterium]|nr:class I SAM-dependent methyltransferase [Lachnospiraceae bacterium]